MSSRAIRSTIVVSVLGLSLALPSAAQAVTTTKKVPVSKVGAKCTKSGAVAKTSKGTALVCKKSGTKLTYALAPKTASTTKPGTSKSADTTVPKSADSTVPKSADTTTPKAADTTAPKATDTTVPK